MRFQWFAHNKELLICHGILFGRRIFTRRFHVLHVGKIRPQAGEESWSGSRGHGWWWVVCLWGWLCQYVNFVRWLKEKMMYTVYSVCSYYPGGRFELWGVIFPRSKLRHVMIFRRSRPGDFVLSSKLIVGGSQDLRRESMTELAFSEGLTYLCCCLHLKSHLYPL